MALNPLTLQHAMNPKPIQPRLLNDDHLEGFSGPRKRLLLSSDRRINSAAMFPADTPCFDIFSPAPGESDVISQVERLSSKETKIAPRLVRIAVGSSKW